MKRVAKIFLFGAFIWGATFLLGMLIYIVVPPESALFDSIMAVSMAASATLFSFFYLKASTPENWTSITIGFIWMGIAIFLDIPWFFLIGDMKMTISDYVADIALTYFMIPIITAGIGYALRHNNRNASTF